MNLKEYLQRIDAAQAEFERKTIQPLEVVKGFKYNEGERQYSAPFASQTEWGSFLSGSEGTVLCTTSAGESVLSYYFVQCSGALVRNTETGLVSLIHQSTWSAAASAILAAQRGYDLEVITVQGPFGRMSFETIQYAHQNELEEMKPSFEKINRKDPLSYPVSENGTNDVKHHFLDYSRIRGISTGEISNYFTTSAHRPKKGQTTWLGVIKLPVNKEEGGRWSMLYRPTENVIRIFESGTSQLFTYPGFSALS